MYSTSRRKKVMLFSTSKGYRDRYELSLLCPKLLASITTRQICFALRDHNASDEYSGIASTGISSQSTANAENTFHSDTIPISRSRCSSNPQSMLARYVHSKRHQSQICRRHQSVQLHHPRPMVIARCFLRSSSGSTETILGIRSPSPFHSFQHRRTGSCHRTPVTMDARSISLPAALSPASAACPTRQTACHTEDNNLIQLYSNLRWLSRFLDFSSNRLGYSLANFSPTSSGLTGRDSDK